MKAACLLLFLLPFALAFGQSSDLFDKAPPGIDDALRARINIFYQANVSGKFKDAFQVVADDSQDAFLGAEHDKYESCKIAKINYSDNFTKAQAVTACKGEYHWRGQSMPVTMPLTSTWKLVDGQWYWYHVKQTSVQSPFGTLQAGPANSGPAELSALPADPAVLADRIVHQVSIDKNELLLSGYQDSQGEVHVTSAMPGEVEIEVDRLPYPGLTVKVKPAKLKKGGTATIVFAYAPNGSATAALPTLTANVRVLPLNQVLPVKLMFAVPPASPAKPPQGK